MFESSKFLLPSLAMTVKLPAPTRSSLKFSFVSDLTRSEMVHWFETSSSIVSKQLWSSCCEATTTPPSPSSDAPHHSLPYISVVSMVRCASQSNWEIVVRPRRTSTGFQEDLGFNFTWIKQHFFIKFMDITSIYTCKIWRVDHSLGSMLEHHCR